MHIAINCYVICFVAVHTWKPKDFVTMGKKVLGALTSRPKGITLCSSYVHNTEVGVFTVQNQRRPEKRLKPSSPRAHPK